MINIKISINLISNFVNLPCESIGKIIKKLSGFDEIQLTEKENKYFDDINNKNQIKKKNYIEGKFKAWETRRTKAENQKKEIEDLKKQIAGAIQKEQKEDLPKRDLPIQQTNFKKSIYYKQLPSQNTQQTQKEKDFIKEYQSRGVLKL